MGEVAILDNIRKNTATDTTGSDDGDWLSPLPVGTVFIDTADNFFGDEAIVEEKEDFGILLRRNGRNTSFWVLKPKEYCEIRSLVEVLIKG